LWQARTAGGKLAINTEHEDFPAILAECLDGAASIDFDLAAAAPKLGISSSQLVKFLKTEPSALAVVNRERLSQGFAAYR
jgi:hypothetical protein